MKCRRGDVVLVWFPHSNQQTFSRRPALVVQADNLDTGIDQIVVALVTTNLSRASHPSRVFLPLGAPVAQSSGLKSDSVGMTDNLATVLGKSVHSIIGKLSDMNAVDTALRNTLGL